MLTLTHDATTIVRDLAAQPGVPEGASLRIALLDEPQPGFSLGATVDETGRVELALGLQA